jgi:hypothetical protein
MFQHFYTRTSSGIHPKSYGDRAAILSCFSFPYLPNAFPHRTVHIWDKGKELTGPLFWRAEIYTEQKLGSKSFCMIQGSPKKIQKQK